MKLLLDTQLFLWAAGQPERISKSARKLPVFPSRSSRLTAILKNSEPF